MALLSSAVCFLCGSVGARRVSLADRPPFPLIKSSEIFHLSVSRPRRSVAACSRVCLLTVSLSNLHQTLATVSVSLMVLWLQLFRRFLSFYWQVRLFAVTQASPDGLPESGDRRFLPKPFGSIFFYKVLTFPPLRR